MSSPEYASLLDALFPTPSLPPSVLAPRRFPNIGPEPTASLLKTLKHNHKQSHVFFNSYSFHNHAAHHLICIWALGASGPLIESAYYDTHLDHMRDAFKSPVEITEENFNEYLGDENYYSAYLIYFHDGVMKKSISEQAEMLNRFVEILIHPIIHTGYGAEFGLPGMLAEGLAQTSVHPAGATVLASRLLFKSEGRPAVPQKQTHAFTILAQMLQDPRFSDKILDKHEYAEMLESRGNIINEYAAHWVVEINSPKDLEYYMEQLIWVSVMIYGIGSWSETKPYAADFFTAHAVTSALFLPSICAHISPRSQSLLLRAHFLAIITWWLVRGRPAFPVIRFLSSPTAPTLPKSVGPQPTPAPEALPAPDSEFAITPNPWLPLLHRTKGYFVGTGLPEAEELDGSLFIRVALLTADTLGWVREGEPNSGVWNYQEFERAAIERDAME
ncbi:hypothetical protein BV22DRAFT_1040659 [Leucogyrophana mollusca]|uniref:Uncharacterized protein n=1 Tax=Leucogyrophana mollusca TaxID=85980 RepID=A0ACB8B335_9AGAM|nr:hypothetical protein BV22DRAFT_1040659 [Leucogyrophana mollusca]